MVHHANDKKHHGRHGTVVGTTAEYVHVELYSSRVPHKVIRKHNSSIRTAATRVDTFIDE